jgi:hypothetical protein
MRYNYEVWNWETRRRLEITTNFDRAVNMVRLVPNKAGRIDIADNLEPASKHAPLFTEDDFLGWQTKLERDNSWVFPKKTYNALEETDGFHVTEHPVEPQVPNVVHDFAGAADSFNEVLREIAKGPQHLIDNNAKTAAAVGKPQMSGIPPIALLALGTAMQDGVNKYGLTNWRDSQVSATVFYDAMMRHLLAWYSGEDCAADSHVVHLGHLMAGAAILLDAELHGCLNDNRPKGEHITAEILSFVKR